MPDSILLKTFLEHEKALLRFLRGRLGSPASAADILHDMQLKLVRGVPHDGVREPRAYIFSMAANLATDHLRAERRRREILEEAREVVWHRTEELTPERHAVANAELAYLERIVATFPARRREILYLSRFEELSQAEIAERLGLGITTIYKELKTAMLQLMEARQKFQSGQIGTGNHDPTRQSNRDPD